MSCRLLKVIIFIISLCFKVVDSNAQLYDIRQYTTSDGLPANTVYSVFMDSRDFLWISGEGGFCRFDGKKFYPVHNADGNILSAANITFEDSLNELWGMTINGSYKFNRREFIEFPFRKKRPENLWVTQLFLSKRKTVCMVVASGVYELQNNVWQKIEYLKNDSGIFYNQIIELDNEKTLINFRDSICILNKQSQLKRIQCKQETYPIFKSLKSFNNESFLFTNQHLYQYRNDTLQILYPEEINASVTDVYLDDIGKLWVGIENYGVKIFDGINGKLNPIQEIRINNFNGYFYLDRYKNMWISSKQGLLKVTPKYSQAVKSPGLEICDIFKAGNKKIGRAHV